MGRITHSRLLRDHYDVIVIGAGLGVAKGIERRLKEEEG